MDFLKQIETNWDRLTKDDALAKAQGTLIGRFFGEPFADGKAIYRITGTNKTKAKIEVVTGLGDDWEIPYWGHEKTIDLAYVQKKIEGRDSLNALFGR